MVETEEDERGLLRPLAVVLVVVVVVVVEEVVVAKKEGEEEEATVGQNQVILRQQKFTFPRGRE